MEAQMMTAVGAAEQAPPAAKACHKAIVDYGRCLGLDDEQRSAFSRSCTDAALEAARPDESPAATVRRALRMAAQASGLAPPLAEAPSEAATTWSNGDWPAELAEKLAASRLGAEEFFVPESAPQPMPAHPLGELLPIVEPRLWRQRIAGAIADAWSLVERALRLVS